MQMLSLQPVQGNRVKAVVGWVHACAQRDVGARGCVVAQGAVCAEVGREVCHLTVPSQHAWVLVVSRRQQGHLWEPCMCVQKHAMSCVACGVCVCVGGGMCVR